MSGRAMSLVIFSDIDGTLIDFDSYSWSETAAAVARVVAAGIPLVLCSSKTAAEQAFHRQELAIPDPYIVENGSAIFIPDGYFPNTVFGGPRPLVLGRPAGEIRAALEAVRLETGLRFRGYHDLTVAEVSAVTGLDLAAADRARQRDFSETIVDPLSPAELALLRPALTRRGLAVASGGRFHTVMGAAADKGAAVRRLTSLFQAHHGRVITVGLGDSANDLPLLDAVDRPYLVQRPDHTWQEIGFGTDEPAAARERAITRVPAVGPAGWRWVVEGLLEEVTLGESTRP
jgi:mannosyl-3-phosphoglycerate phosphatase